MVSAIVCRRENSQQLSTARSLVAVLNTFVCSQYVVRIAHVQKAIDKIFAEFHHFSGILRVPIWVKMNTTNTIIFTGIRPQDLDDNSHFKRLVILC